MGCSTHIQTDEWCFHGTLVDVRVGTWECAGTEFAGAAGQDPMSREFRATLGDLTEALQALVRVYAFTSGVGVILDTPVEEEVLTPSGGWDEGLDPER